MNAYFSALNFRSLNSALFRSALLFYSKLYLPINPSLVDWSIALGEEEPDVSLFVLKSYLEYSPTLFNKILPRLHYVGFLDDQMKALDDLFLDYPSLIFNPRVFEQMVEVVKDRVLSLGIPWEKYISTLNALPDIVLMHQEMFISSLLARNHQIDTIMVIGEALMRIELMARADISLEENSSIPQGLPFDTLHTMLGKLKSTSDLNVLDIKDALVPNLENIPLNELVEFIALDKARPISQYINEIVEKYGSGLTSNDLANEVIDQLFKVAHILWPSVGDIAIGVIGEIPLPIPLNPVGLWGTFMDIKTKYEVDRKYAWILAVKELREMSTNPHQA